MTDLPTPEMAAEARAEYLKMVPSWCVICWHPKPGEDVDNGLCSECRRDLRKRQLAVVTENARLRETVYRLRKALDAVDDKIREVYDMDTDGFTAHPGDAKVALKEALMIVGYTLEGIDA